MGATHDAWAVMSFARAAGRPPINTVGDPTEITPGPPGTQLGKEHGAVVSVDLAAGKLLISTFDAPLMIAKGKAGWGTGVGTGADG